ncbi:hypothetical protein JKP76_04995 [Blastococcus sp. TML/C7B]|nr:hypothetical protein [Blastococcus sp. TML/C7B]
MIRPAAGGTGGRPAVAPGPDRPGARRGALLRAALLPVLLSTVCALAPPASAAPAPATAPPVLAAAPSDDDDSDPDRPIRVDVKGFEPRTVTPGSLVTVRGFLTNTGTTPIEGVTIRLQRGDVLLSRADLADADADGDEPSAVVAPFQDGPELVPAGETVSFSYTVDSAELRLDRDGVYPVLLNVNGSVDGDVRRVGELSTFVVQQPLQPVARTAVAWLWPLTERTHRTASGRFADDDLAESVSPEGRLDRALSVVERLPTPTPPGSATPVPDVPVTLAIDPALIEELEVMAAGPYEVPGGQGAGTDAAREFLARLRTVAAVHAVVALPYGDVDADALERAGLGEVVTRSLPGTGAGTAQDPPAAADGTPTGTPTAPAAESEAPAGPTAPDEGAGARILAEALDVEPRTDLAWAPGGTLLPGTLARLQEGGIEQVVLGPDAVSTGNSAIGLGDPTAAAAVTVGSPSGPVGGLVADARLGHVVGLGEVAEGGPRLAEQRYLAELGVLTAQAPPGTEQTVLVAAPRDVDAGPDSAGAMMADTATLPWLRATTLESLTAGTPTEDGELVEPGDDAAPPRPGRAADRPRRHRLAGRPGARRRGRRRHRAAGVRRRDRPRHLGGLADRPRRLPGRRRRPGGHDAADAWPGDPAGAGRRHVHAGLQRRAPSTHRPQRPALRRAGAARGAGPRQPGAVHRRHRRPGARAG